MTDSVLNIIVNGVVSIIICTGLGFLLKFLLGRNFKQLDESIKELKENQVPRKELEIYIKKINSLDVTVDKNEKSITRLEAHAEIKEKFMEDVRDLNRKMGKILDRDK